jgi:uncharacterized ParB-like nuclease family protein
MLVKLQVVSPSERSHSDKMTHLRRPVATVWTTNKVGITQEYMNGDDFVNPPLPCQFQNQLAAFPSLHFGYSFVM